MAAAQAGHLDVVEALIGSGASPSKTMWDGASPLFLAAQNGHARVLVYLLDQPGLPLDTQRRDGASPLWIAARGGRLTSLDASFARCFAFLRTSSKTSTSMFFQKHRIVKEKARCFT